MSKQLGKLLALAKDEVGYLEKRTEKSLDSKTANAGQANFTKYGAWFGWNGVAWCHIFVSWVAAQAGCAALIPRTASCYEGRDWFTARNQFGKRGKYTPKAGDIVYFSSGTYPDGGAHVGIVTACYGGRVYTVEGNTSAASGVIANGGGVAAKSYALTYDRIYGYGQPNYEEDENLTKQETLALIRAEMDKQKEVYNTIAAVPEWGKATVQKLIDAGALKGTGGGLGLTYDTLRVLVVNDRAGVYDNFT